MHVLIHDVAQCLVWIRVSGSTLYFVANDRGIMTSSPQPAAKGVNVRSEAMDTLLSRHGRDPHALVQILRELQESAGWLSRESLESIAGELGLTLAHVEGVGGFYRFLHTRPVGHYRVLFSD